jgi:HPt (histidine-containing phosphotransfer) domain-containing protein
MREERSPCLEQVGPGAEAAAEKLDPAAILARVGGNVRLLQEVVTMFLDDCPRCLEEIQDAIARGDAPGLRYAAHRLHGSLSNFGTPVALDQVRQLEAMARAGDLACAADVYPILERASERFQQALAELAQKLAPAMPDHLDREYDAKPRTNP